MREWIQLEENILCELTSDNYILINKSVDDIALNETTLLVKFVNGDKSLQETFTVMGHHNETIDTIETELEIFEWFYKNTNGAWSSDIKILRNYIDQLPTNNNIQ